MYGTTRQTAHAVVFGSPDSSIPGVCITIPKGSRIGVPTFEYHDVQPNLRLSTGLGCQNPRPSLFGGRQFLYPVLSVPEPASTLALAMLAVVVGCRRRRSVLSFLSPVALLLAQGS